MAKKKTLIPPPNLLEKAIAYVAPRMALERHKARTAMALTGGYSGAKVDRAALSNWRTYAGSPESDISPDLISLRARGRDLVRNTPVAAGAIAQTTTNVIGTGLALAPAPDADYLGLSPEALADWKRNTIREWKLFAENKDADLGRRMNFYQLQELAFRSFFESGDIFFLTPRKPRGNVYDLALQAIEADRISNPNHGSNTDTLIDGIEIDADGAPVKCHICTRHPGGLRRAGIKWQEFNFYGTNNRRNVLHLFKPLRPGQVRGVSMLAPIIEPLKQLGTYTNAELQAAVTSGMFSIFVKMDPDAFSSLFDNDAASAIVKESGKWDGNLDNDGRAVNLLPGESIESANPGRPNSEFDPFVQSILRQIGMALEIPYEVLIMHFQSSYSAAKGALMTAWKTYRKWRDWMATEFCQPVYVLWLDEAVAKGRISCPGYFASPAVRAAWQGALWIGDGPGSLDPVKEADAAEKRIDLGISTIEAESILHDGIDWEVKHEQRAKEESMRKQAGLIREKTTDRIVTEPITPQEPDQ